MKVTGRRKWKRVVTAAGLILSLACPGAFGADAGTAQAAEDEVKSFSLGPGYEELPYSDSYGSYQWAFLNSGVLKLVPGKRETLADMISEDKRGTGKGREQNGPAREGEESIRSVRGIDMNMIPAWKKYDEKQGKRSVVVALIDTGADVSHPELTDSLWTNPGEIPGDGIDNDGNGYADDVHGWNFYDNNNQIFTGTDDNHGTHSAGTIAAARNGIGTVGICDSAYVKIMPLKILGTSSGVGTAKDVVWAIQYAKENGAAICNLSFGTAKYSEELYQAIRDSGMLFVVAAGNGDESGKGYDIDGKPVYPASFDLDNILSVANLQLDGKLDAASNYGVNDVDLAAPGSYILSTVSGNGYAYMSGTSMAAPMVTGVAAMMYSYNPTLSVTEVKGRILSSVRSLDSLTGKTVTGGMPDAAAALSLCD